MAADDQETAQVVDETPAPAPRTRKRKSSVSGTLGIGAGIVEAIEKFRTTRDPDNWLAVHFEKGQSRGSFQVVDPKTGQNGPQELQAYLEANEGKIIYTLIKTVASCNAGSRKEIFWFCPFKHDTASRTVHRAKSGIFDNQVFELFQRANNTQHLGEDYKAKLDLEWFSKELLRNLSSHGPDRLEYGKQFWHVENAEVVDVPDDDES